MVSPRCSVNDTPSTARTSPFFRGMTPPKTGNRTFRSRTSRMTSEVAMAIVVEVTADPVIGRGFDQRRLNTGTGLKALRAAGRELTPDGQIVDIRNRPGDCRQPGGPFAVDSRQ